MTIKQQGGIFGRNPTFNDVEAAKVNVDTTTDNEVIGQFALWDSTQSAQPYLRMAHSLGTSIGSHTAVTVNDMLGSVAFAGSTGTAFYDGASIEGKATQTYTASNGGTKLLFKTTPDGGQTLTEQMSLDQDGTLTVANGNIVIGTSGKGIDFSATSGTGTSELFDDYEEGTWTPSYTPTTGSFTTMTYNNQEGYYTKIGDLVYINCLISTNNSNPSGGSGVLLISGLPYTCGASADHSLTISGAVNWGGDYPLAGQVIESSSTIKFQYRTAVNGATIILDVSDMATSTSSNRNYIRFSGCYKV